MSYEVGAGLSSSEQRVVCRLVMGYRSRASFLGESVPLTDVQAHLPEVEPYILHPLLRRICNLPLDYLVPGGEAGEGRMVLLEAPEGFELGEGQCIHAEGVECTHLAILAPY